MVIELLILFPLYRVIYNVPGYITRIRNIFTDSVNGIMGTDGFAGIMDNFYNTVKEGNYVMKNIGGVAFDGNSTDAANSIIDVLYRCCLLYTSPGDAGAESDNRTPSLQKCCHPGKK